MRRHMRGRTHVVEGRDKREGKEAADVDIESPKIGRASVGIQENDDVIHDRSDRAYLPPVVPRPKAALKES